MCRKHIFKGLVFFLFSPISMILTFNTSMGQVRFEEPINLSDNPSDSWNPRIAAVDDQVFVVWRDELRPRFLGDILLAHSRDNGMTFRIWNLTGDLEIHNGMLPGVIADNDNIYVGWPGQGGGGITTWAPFLSRSNDGGETFSPPFDLSGRAAYGVPIMGIQDGALNVAWGGYDQVSHLSDILFTKSTDFGQTFREPVMVSDISQRDWVLVVFQP